MVKMDNKTKETLTDCLYCVGGLLALGLCSYLSTKREQAFTHRSERRYRYYDRPENSHSYSYRPESQAHTTYSTSSYTVYDYGDAIEAIADSDMDSFYKREIVRVVAIDADSEYYKAVKGIVESDNMESFDKRMAIIEISRRAKS